MKRPRPQHPLSLLPILPRVHSHRRTQDRQKRRGPSQDNLVPLPPTATAAGTKDPVQRDPDKPSPTKTSTQPRYDKARDTYVGWGSGALNKLCERERHERTIAASKEEYTDLAVQEAQDVTDDAKTAQEKADHAFKVLVNLETKILWQGRDTTHLTDCDTGGSNAASWQRRLQRCCH